ncbi:unnamed protein product [Caenorhabditis angaria]|uniref:Uncharacterized protein n=1 Tax=Caenorhabditis angaria TaxID=860376 RepID=A0A9P1N2R9_9PELO|nr:unnamed protein product [Caenorhabditis angaria]
MQKILEDDKKRFDCEALDGILGEYEKEKEKVNQITEEPHDELSDRHFPLLIKYDNLMREKDNFIKEKGRINFASTKCRLNKRIEGAKLKQRTSRGCGAVIISSDTGTYYGTTRTHFLTLANRSEWNDRGRSMERRPRSRPVSPWGRPASRPVSPRNQQGKRSSHGGSTDIGNPPKRKFQIRLYNFNFTSYQNYQQPFFF